MLKDFFKNSSLLIFSLLILFGLAEITLRFLPVYDSFYFQPVNEESQTFRAAPDRTVMQSRYWNMSKHINKRVNNAGFVNINDYKLGETPLVAVVGDSYVEAVQVEDDETFFYLLDKKADNARVYSFGFSGAGLSQYLIWARLAKQDYDNDFLIINVVGNDFDESLKKYKFASGFYHYAPDANGDLQLVRNNWKPKWYSHIIRRSSLARYSLYNLNAKQAIRNAQSMFAQGKQQFVGNVATDASNDKITESYAAIDAFFRDLPQYSGLKPEKILFTVDGMRGSIYAPWQREIAEQSYVNKMRVYLFKRAAELGYAVLDLDEAFSRHYKQHKVKFEFVDDGHWNKTGHAVVAEAVAATPFWQEVINY